MKRNQTRSVMVGDVQIGGNDNVVIQSMTTTKPSDVDKTIEQINRLVEAGCQIVRVSCPTIEDAKAIKEIKKQVSCPIVADIHFNYLIALEAIEAGVDKIRINPGNIGNDERVEAVVNACKEKHIPIRIGVNAGSLEKHILEKYGYPTWEGMIESAKYHVDLLEKLDFHDIVISLKASSLDMAIKAYEEASEMFDYPLHVGITESGTGFGGTIKSSIGIGILLNQGIGNTIRVSISENPVEEIKVAREILKDLNLITDMPTLISCPTCGRIAVDMFPIVHEIEDFLQTIKAPIKVSVLGCAVNGPGEAKEADIGIACARGEGLLFRHGVQIEKVKEEQLVDRLKAEIKILEQEYLENKDQNK